MRTVLAVFLMLMGCMATTAAMAERRVALVVGNSQYAHTAPLPNPRNDAQDMAAQLRQVGFEVTAGYDLDQVAFARTIDDFARALEGADVALFFYAGHGLQINEKNYLVSTGARLESSFLVASETIELDAIIRLMESKTGTNLIFLDACRNNPLAETLKRSLAAINRSTALGRGLARVEPTGRDTLVAFSAAPGQEAADGRGRNSPFTASLLKHMPQPGLEVSVMLKEVAADVRADTANAQRPQQLSDMSKTFYFVNPAPAVASPPAAPLAGNPPPADPVDLAYWQSASAANECESMRAYIRRFPQGAFADLARLAEPRLCDTRDKVAVLTPPGGAAANSVSAAAVPAAPPVSPAASQPATKVAATPPTVAVMPAAPPVSPAPSRPGTDVAALPPAATPAASDVAREIQRELLRVGCGATLKADGTWDAASRDALRAFVERTRSVTAVDEPTPEALAALRGAHDPVCPLQCEPGTQMRGGSCVAKPGDRHAARPAERKRSTHAPRQAEELHYGNPVPIAQPAGRVSPQFSGSPFYVGSRRCLSMDHLGGAPRIVCP